jgi:ribose-phosphate pyrophosphokinase
MEEVMPANPNPILISSPGMHEMAQKIFPLLSKNGQKFSYCELRNDRGTLEYGSFANGEIGVMIPENVRCRHVYLLHPLQYPDPNIAFMGMLIIADALTRASAASITLILPYIPYLRQDRKDKPHVPITARLIADMIEINKKIERIITFDMHVDQEQGFFKIPIDPFPGSIAHAAYFRERFRNNFSNVTVVSADVGSIVRSQRFGDKLGSDIPLVILEKKRKNGKTVVENIIGPSIMGRDVILYDDMIDTGGTIIASIDFLKERRPRSIHIAATHGLFSKGAEGNFQNKGAQISILPTIPRTEEYWKKHRSWLTPLPIESLLAEAIYRSYVGESISDLF